jgi:hypothetical protein
MTKNYIFNQNYDTKYGKVSKGEILSGRLSTNNKVLFEYFQYRDPSKAEAGEGTFSMYLEELNQIASEYTGQPVIEETEKKKPRVKITEKITRKHVVIGSLVVLALATVSFIIYKRSRV